MADNLEYPDVHLMHPDKYAKVKKKAIKKLAGHENVTDPEDFKLLAEALGLAEDLTWKPKLRLVT